MGVMPLMRLTYSGLQNGMLKDVISLELFDKHDETSDC